MRPCRFRDGVAMGVVGASGCVIVTRMPFTMPLNTTAAHDFRDEISHSELDMQFDDVGDGSKLDIAEIIKSVFSQRPMKLGSGLGECQETYSNGLGKLSIPRSKTSMDKETTTIVALNLKRRQYFVNPSAISRYRSRYKKYMLSPKSMRRKKLFSTRSQMLFRRIMFGLADSRCAGIQIQ